MGRDLTLQQFLAELARNNNRPWFQAHRDTYERLREQWYADLNRLLAAMSAWEPSAAWLSGREVSYRIYRDIRFSPDKTPYKTYFSAHIDPVRGADNCAGWYIQAAATADNCGLFGGIWAPDSAMLRKLRHAIVDNIEEFEEIISAPELVANYPRWWGPRLKTAPKGWPKDHPNIELLRLLHFGREMPVPPEFFAAPSWPERTAELLRPLKPLIDFINYSLAEEV